MKEQDIQEGNKLIAEFMGCYESEVFWGGAPCKRWGFKDTHISERWTEGRFDVETPYHSSWELLHPVLEKIWSLGAWEYNVTHGFCSINGDHEAPPYIAAANGSTIMAAWQCVIQFIQWYNQQKLENKI